MIYPLRHQELIGERKRERKKEHEGERVHVSVAACGFGATPSEQNVDLVSEVSSVRTHKLGGREDSVILSFSQKYVLPRLIQYCAHHSCIAPQHQAKTNERKA